MKLSHLVDAEYGNQGIDFKMIPREGFGWMNGVFASLLFPTLRLLHAFPRTAAYQVGLTFLSTGMRRAAAACTSPEVYFGAAANLQNLDQPYAAAASTDPLSLAMDQLHLSEPISPTY